MSIGPVRGVILKELLMGSEAFLPDAASHASASPQWWVVCLCAQWCGVCREYRQAFEQTARAWPQMRFEWVDVEDEEEVVGDLDVETFPTVLIADGRAARFLGPLLPQATVLGRMLQSLQQASQVATMDSTAQDLFERIRSSRQG